MESTPSTFQISFSSFDVTKSSIFSGLAHGKVVTTKAIQLSTSGADSSERLLSQRTQEIIITIITSQVNLFLSIKKAIQDLFSFSSNSNFSKYIELFLLVINQYLNNIISQSLYFLVLALFINQIPLPVLRTSFPPREKEKRYFYIFIDSSLHQNDIILVAFPSLPKGEG
jgi:hypothetical protein